VDRTLTGSASPHGRDALTDEVSRSKSRLQDAASGYQCVRTKCCWSSLWQFCGGRKNS